MQHRLDNILSLDVVTENDSSVCTRSASAAPLASEHGYPLGSADIRLGDAMDMYDEWLPPTAIVVDGPYGLSSFPGDPPTVAGLDAWYAPHVAAWSKRSLAETTLWFWSSELAWATVHPVLLLQGWRYRALHVWDKGVGHIAGNVNGETIRGFPVVTEVCVQYTREAALQSDAAVRLPLQQWLRREWLRTGLPLDRSNEACGVRNAATRKYFTQDHLWYFPPPAVMERLAEYANQNGQPTSRPYFSLDGKSPLTAAQWARMRAKWHHVHGITNVWSEPAVRGLERIKDGASRPVHANQKPLRLIERVVLASTDEDDVVWEPFGGLCPTAIVCVQTGRHCYSAELNAEYYRLARDRLDRESSKLVRERSTVYQADGNAS